MSLVTGGGVGDVTPPTVSLISPAANSTVSSIVTLQVSATDNIGVASVSATVDDGPLGTAQAAPYSFSWDTRNSANGSHVLAVRAQDAAGNVGTSSITVNVNNLGDVSAPVIVIVSPSNGGAVSGNVSVGVNCSDNIGVRRVELYVDGLLSATSTSAPFGTRWNSRRASAGPHTLRCRAYDAAGNTGDSAVITVYR
jgi:hypothetical protein